MTPALYLKSVDARLRAGNATEHTYRGDLEALLRELTTGLDVTNEPKRVACGAPDYILTDKKSKLPVGYVEAKDIGKPLDSKDYKEQFDRYRKGLTNLIITDYLDFRWYKEGEFVQKVQIAELIDGKLHPLPQNFAAFTELINDFSRTETYTIRNATKLAEMMAGKARMMDEVIKNALMEDTDHDSLTNLSGQYGAFKRVLLHDLSVMEFADIYAQTVTYGMFAARLHDDTPETFSRQEAAELIPKTNPFLRWLFADIAGPNIDERIVWIVDALADIFRHTDMDQVLKDFGKATGQNDPLIHFYEPFLAAYSPALRKSRGVWYTPQPVVNFIVRAVDDILKTEFNLPQGLADTSKVKVKYKAVTQATADKRSKTKEVEAEREVHKVQILDPATGTGTFLAEVIRQMHGKFKGMEGMWPNYVEEHLLPRINGFELLMASYAMAHLKLDMVLRETGVDTTKLNKRLKVYLTNSLEEADAQMPDLFSAALAREAAEANTIKRDTPVMVVLGNPPYSISSSNTGDWILDLLNDYKKGLNERNIQPLSDDYIKFIRYGQHFIDKNGSGVLAFITNNSYLDGVIHRQMRKSLATTFNKIYIIDLHGSSKRQEKDAEGNKDENVFDILPGTAIALFVRNEKNTSTEIFSVDVFGERQRKYDFLEASSISTIDWNTIQADNSECFFIPRNTEGESVFQKFICVKSLFQTGANGIQTERDSVTIQFTPDDISNVASDFKELKENEIAAKYQIDKEGRDWKIANAKEDILSKKGALVSVLYRPFDNRFSWYSGKTKGFMAYARPVISDHLVQKNVGLVVGRQGQIHSKGPWDIVHITKHILDRNLFYRGGNMTFPLYLYPSTDQLSTEGQGIRPNIDEKLAKQLAVAIGCDYVFDEARAWEHGTPGKEIMPLDILDYTYAVLHSPAYREKYKEFLKIDFPRIPYCTDEGRFRELVRLGAELRGLHLLEDPLLPQLSRIIGFPIAGDNVVRNKMTTASPGYVLDEASEYEGKVYINETQYFQYVPKVSWEFYIGGYQPAQKWLKDRQGRTLTYDDIRHYQQIIGALHETDRVMQEVDAVGVL
jgi:predicted helicase